MKYQLTNKQKLTLLVSSFLAFGVPLICWLIGVLR